MFGEGHHGRTVQRGIDEALACRDMLMLESALEKPSLLARTLARIVSAVRAFAPAPRREQANRQPATSSAPGSVQ